MYGRPAESAASSMSLFAFDNSITPIRFTRSIFERRVFLADPPFFAATHPSAKTFQDPAGYRSAITLLPRQEERLMCAAHRDHFEFVFVSAPPISRAATESGTLG